MPQPRRRYHDDVPGDIVRRIGERCLALPETRQEPAWVGTRWRVRTRTFAHVLGIDGDEVDGSVVLAFRASGEELEVLGHLGHPFLVLGWGRNALGLVLDAETDWDEVGELVVESYCTLAPKRLVALVDRPAEAEPPEGHRDPP
jgi:hypothetical protein